MEYVELYNGNFQYIYIDTLPKREKQKSLILDLQNSGLYSFVQKDPKILFYDLVGESNLVEKIKNNFPVIFESFEKNGVTGLIRDFETGIFPLKVLNLKLYQEVRVRKL